MIDKISDTSNTPQGPDEDTPKGTGTEEIVETQTPTTPVEPVVQKIVIKDDYGNVVKEFATQEELAKAYRESEQKMHGATQELSDLKRGSQEKQAQIIKEWTEKEAARLETLQINDPVGYQREMINKAKQEIELTQFQRDRPEMEARARAKFPDYNKYETEVNSLLNSGVAAGMREAYPHRFGRMTPIEVALAIAKSPEIIETEEDKNIETGKRSKVEGEPTPTVGTIPKEEKVTLTAYEKKVAHEMFSKSPPDEAEKMYLRGKG